MNSEPPPSWKEPAPLPAPAPPKKRSFLQKNFRRRAGSNHDAEDQQFRAPGALRSTAFNSNLRQSKSSPLLEKTSTTPSEDPFAPYSNTTPTKKLVTKTARPAGNDTRDLADFLRSSEAPSDFSRTTSRGRASTHGSIDTATSGPKSKLKAFLRGGRRDEETETLYTAHSISTPVPSPGRDSFFGGSWKNTAWSISREDGDSTMATYESISPSALQSSRSAGAGSVNSLDRSGSISGGECVHLGSLLVDDANSRSSFKRSPRKPAPSVDPSLVALESSSPRHGSTLIISPQTLAKLLGDEAKPEQATSPARRTLTSPTTQGAVHRNGSTSGASSEVSYRHKTSVDGILPPRRAFSTDDAPSFKFSRRPATGASKSTADLSASDLRTSSELKRPLRTRPVPSVQDPSPTTQETGVYRSLSLTPGHHARPTSPPPVTPLPATPVTPATRSRPVSIAIQPASPLPYDALLEQHSEANWSRRPSVDSFVDPPLSASGGESGREDGHEIFPSDPIFEALHALKQTMRQAASIPLDATPFRAAGEGSGLRQDQLAALLPALKAMQSQMASAALLLDVVMRRIIGTGDDRDEEEEAGAAAYLLDGSGSSASDSGIGEEPKEQEEDEREEEQEHLEDSEEESFPLLVRHLTISE
mgnify:FL=1